MAAVASARPHGPPLDPGTVRPTVAVLPDVLPTDRLHANGKPMPPVRDHLRRIHNGRNVVNVLGVWLQSFGVVWLALRIANPLGYVVAFALMGRAFALYSILAHEAAHKLLFTNKRLNDWIGRWCIAYPAFVPLDLYRRSHFAHHREEFGPNEPDLNLYVGYPVTRSSLRRKLIRDARGSSGWKNLRALLLAFRSKGSRPIAMRILAGQAMVLVALALVAVGAGSAWWMGLLLYPVLWLAPWMTAWRVINRLRAIAEHGGMMQSPDRRLTTHVVHQSLLARFWMVPYNTGWHLAHHVDMGVPFQNLPALHRELVESGWVTERLEYPSYVALWRALSSRPEGATG